MADGNAPSSTSGNPTSSPGLVARVAQAARYVISGVSADTWMSPLQPLAVVAPPEVKGRTWDFPVGINTRYRPRSGETISFQRLEGLAMGSGVARAVIQRQIELIESFDWSIKPREDAPGKRPAESKFKAQVDEITLFLHTPDRVHDWSQWLHMLLDEVLVFDALSIYRRPTLDGTRLWGLEIISGSTITPLIDGQGRRPQPPSPAYQQVIKGVPAGDFSLEELLYYPRSPRANRLYGYPPLAWVISYVDQFIERQRSQLAYFTEGNITDAIMTGPENWTTDQIKTWQEYWDDQFGGNLEARRHGQWVPHGTTVDQLKEPPLKSDFDEWLAKIICFAFSTSPLPFIKAPARGQQESQQEVAEEGGVATYMQYVKRVLDKIIREDLQHPELEFCWSEDREFDPAVMETINNSKLRSGAKTYNEIRDVNGDDPYDGDWADTPVVITATGVIPLEAAIKRAVEDAENPPQPMMLPGQPGAPGRAGAPPPVSGEAGGGDAGKPAPPPKGGGAQTKQPPAKTPAMAKDVAGAGLYVSRKLTRESAADLTAWAILAGFENIVPIDEMHATQIASRAPVGDFAADAFPITIVGGPRSVIALGPTAIVLTFQNDRLDNRWAEAVDRGASWDFDAYTAHVTISHDSPGLSLPAIEPYAGDLFLGPEIHGPFNKPALAKRARPAVPFDTPKMRAARLVVRPAIEAALERTKTSVVEHVRRNLLQLGKADGDDAEEIAATADLSGLDPIAEAIEDPLAGVAETAGNGALVQVGVNDYSQLTKQVAQRSLVFARDRSAELVGKRWTKDGELIDNPNAKWAITDSTREMLRRTIANGLADNLSVPQIADAIAADYAFSDQRAALIAETEISRANVQGALEGARTARDVEGVVTRKVWLLGQEPCDECETNADQGPIDLDDDFESGDDGPPAHPNCVCSLSWEISDLESDA